MQRHLPRATALLVPLCCAIPLCCVAVAAQDPFPLPSSASVTPASAPFVLPLGTTQTLVTDVNTVSLQGVPLTFTDWDMVALDPTASNVFIPAETSRAAGILRVDLATGVPTMLMLGNGSGVRQSNPALFNAANDDFIRFDPCTYTPWGSLITGEETTGGRFFEIVNPHAATGPYDIVWHTSIPAVSQEGLRFDAAGAMYFIDEDNSGSIYKFVPTTPGDLSAGQSFVLVVSAFTGNPAASWDAASNQGIPRFGAAQWVPMTDPAGNKLTTADPFVYVTTTGGRTAADELNGTPYGRPEDLDVGVLENGNQVIYAALTSENVVIAIELIDATTCFVHQYCNYDTIDLATGVDVNPLQNASNPYTGSGPFDNPDNIAVDAFGSVYVIEDNNPGDVWKCFDENRDGVAESLGRFASLGIPGSEPTGMIADPTDPYRFYCCVQHPSSDNDALWVFDTRPYPGANADLTLRTGVNVQTPNAFPGEFVKGAGSGDALTFDLRSDGGSLAFAPYLVLLQGRSSHVLSQSIPTLWLDLMQPLFIIDGGITSSGLAQVLPPAGSATTLLVPNGFGGISLATQGLALTPFNTLAFSDAHVFVLP